MSYIHNEFVDKPIYNRFYDVKTDKLDGKEHFIGFGETTYIDDRMLSKAGKYICCYCKKFPLSWNKLQEHIENEHPEVMEKLKTQYENGEDFEEQVIPKTKVLIKYVVVNFEYQYAVKDKEVKKEIKRPSVTPKKKLLHLNLNPENVDAFIDKKCKECGYSKEDIITTNTSKGKVSVFYQKRN